MAKLKLKMHLLFNEPIELNPKKIKKAEDFKSLDLDILEKKKGKFLMEVGYDSEAWYKHVNKKSTIDLETLKEQAELFEGLEGALNRSEAYKAAKDHKFYVEMKVESFSDGKIDMVRNMFLCACLVTYTERPTAIYIPQTGLVVSMDDFQHYAINNMGDKILSACWFNIILKEKNGRITAYSKGLDALKRHDLEVTMPVAEKQNAHHYVRNLGIHCVANKKYKDGQESCDLNDVPYTMILKKSKNLGYEIFEMVKD